jgi:hypothetical protein
MNRRREGRDSSVEPLEGPERVRPIGRSLLPLIVTEFGTKASDLRTLQGREINEE